MSTEALSENFTEKLEALLRQTTRRLKLSAAEQAGFKNLARHHEQNFYTLVSFAHQRQEHAKPRRLAAMLAAVCAMPGLLGNNEFTAVLVEKLQASRNEMTYHLNEDADKPTLSRPQLRWLQQALGYNMALIMAARKVVMTEQKHRGDIVLVEWEGNGLPHMPDIIQGYWSELCQSLKTEGPESEAVI